MKRLYIAAVATAMAAMPTLKADTFTIAANAASHVVGSGNSAPGFSTSSWQAAAGPGQKSEFYIAASSVFTGAVTLNDIQSISYWTNKPGTSGSPDWTFYMYTTPTASGNEASWYHTRFNSEPYLTGTSDANDPSNTWHDWSTDDAANPMRFYDQGRSGNYGTYTDPTLAALQAGAIDWNSFSSANKVTNIDYRNETINLFSLQTGSAWANGFTGLVDGVTITLKDGQTANLNLEATPEPTSWVLLGTLSLGLVISMRRRMAGRG